MRFDILGLQAFVAIAEQGSFHEAAARLGITQTALSHRIAKFEDHLGVALLARTTRRVSLTPAGLALLPRARDLLVTAREIFADLGAEAAGRQERLAIGCLPTLAVHLLPQVLKTFLAAHPGLMVRVHDNSASEIEELVRKGEAEFAVTILSSDRWDLEIKPLLKEPYVLVCRADHPFATRRSVTWRELAGEPLVRISTRTGNRFLIDDALGAGGERLSWTCEVQHVASAVALVAEGAGLTIVPRIAVDVAQDRSLASVALRAPSITRTLGAVTRRGVPLTPIAAELLRLVEARLRQPPDRRQKADRTKG